MKCGRLEFHSLIKPHKLSAVLCVITVRRWHEVEFLEVYAMYKDTKYHIVITLVKTRLRDRLFFKYRLKLLSPGGIKPMAVVKSLKFQVCWAVHGRWGVFPPSRFRLPPQGTPLECNLLFVTDGKAATSHLH